MSHSKWILYSCLSIYIYVWGENTHTHKIRNRFLYVNPIGGGETSI